MRTLLTSLLLAALVFGGPCHADGPRAAERRLDVATLQCDGAPEAGVVRLGGADTTVRRGIPEFFLGTNILYWLDDDATWEQGRQEKALTRLGLKTLRYPGGEVADNYDWETHSIERKASFPKEAETEEERLGRLDYKEFLARARALGAGNLFFVVNLEGAFFQSGPLDANIERYADKAARWVKAVRDAGYFVPYWEIGNESYLASAYPLRAVEYARALKVFARKMRQADPRIRIGAVGPFTFQGDDAVGYADFIGDETLAAYRRSLAAGVEEPCREQNRWKCGAHLGVNAGVQRQSARWWDVVTAEARDAFDFAVIHRYRSARIGPDKQVRFSGGLELARDLGDFKQTLRLRLGRDVQVNMTEWNTPAPFHNVMSDMQHAMDIVEQLGNQIEAGVDHSLYWPWRMKTNKFPLLGEKWAEKSTFHALRLFQEFHGPDFLESREHPGGLYVLTTGGDGLHHLIVNHGDVPARAALTPNRRDSALYAASLLPENGEVDGLSRARPSAVPAGCAVIVNLPAQSVTGLRLEPR